jgi:Ser/Thr protein kinase RdoA (MazF antagonist)
LSNTFDVDTDAGRVFLRFAQPSRTLAIVEAEHRAICFAGDAGIPVARPLVRPGGGTAVEVDGRVASAYPFIAGRNARRRAITPGEAASLGTMHGRVQAVLASYEDPELAGRSPGEIAWDTAAAIATLHRLDALLSAGLYGIEERHARRAVRLQLLLLESGLGRPASDFAHLPVQVEHGDFHERNVILSSDGDEVLAVVDWERVRPLPRAFQLVRAIDFMRLAGTDLVEVYASAFGKNTRLPTTEVREAVEQWWQSNLHNTWVFSEVYERGNGRAAMFVAEVENRLRRLADEGFRERLASSIASGCAR